MIGGSLVGLELAELLAERGRKVTLLHESQQLELPLAMPRRWTAVRHAREHGVDIQRQVPVTRITDSSVDWNDAKGNASSGPAAMVICAEGTTVAALSKCGQQSHSLPIECAVSGAHSSNQSRDSALQFESNM